MMRRVVTGRVLRILLTTMIGAATLHAAPKKPEITFETDAVVARVTPGARTAWFGIVRVPSGYGLRFSEHARVETDSDGDGVVRFTLAGVGDRDSIWLAVDMSSGESALEGPSVQPKRRKTLPATALQGRGNGMPAKIAGRHEVALVWLVRPGVGAWHATIVDGTSKDGDGASDGAATALLTTMRAVGDSPAAPDNFTRGDLVVAVDPFTFAASDLRVEE